MNDIFFPHSRQQIDTRVPQVCEKAVIADVDSSGFSISLPLADSSGVNSALTGRKKAVSSIKKGEKLP